mmetsp:Transcript_17179/g.29686  ORF Transcript_17179/g.29686 Transcript_17179/m.29686 type:complete len:110 (+) Transcript_17179:159-488(+)|eukprot:CAMPEP_0196658720 /NCGR_PEP_ID=MMETSP1086-20130531/31082_1 /TAXON_ID=77921 /ORGANISM="Cyanoptyche  gloeocystis , Strain SAG4.97" /LENGTH=109 /DNA_ID=CAMNT_0041992399 /DNA_START=141 /DNA_END=470 /DNA_ORIENTATION=+
MVVSGIVIPPKTVDGRTIDRICSSLGGTMYAMTPGGSRIVYDRSTLLRLSASPLSHNTVGSMQTIPGVTFPCKNSLCADQPGSDDSKISSTDSDGCNSETEDGHVFELD